MRKLGIASFTPNGKLLGDRLEKMLSQDYAIIRYEKGLKEWCAECFAQAESIVFIGACGIAVRTIAPFLKSKTTDPAVVVLDEKGQYVISVLSGHIGGANAFARMVAEKIDATAVITTASDVNGKIAVDVFAKKNHLRIASMMQAKKIAAMIVGGEKVGLWCDGDIEGGIPQELTLIEEKSELEKDDLKGILWISVHPIPEELLKKKEAVLHLIPGSLFLGLGCRKDKEPECIRQQVRKVCDSYQIDARAFCRIASIDLKKEEKGILALKEEWQIPFDTYTAEELLQVKGEFQISEFVRKTTGVDNVCERSALLAAGEGAELIVKKYAENGVTVAVASQKWRVRFEE